MPPCVVGSSYYGVIDGEPTLCVLALRTRHKETQDFLYVLGIPTDSDGFRARLIRANRTAHEKIWVRLVILKRLNHLGKGPRRGLTYADWGSVEGSPIVPRLDDLVAMTEKAATMPLERGAVKISGVDESLAEDDEEEDEDAMDMFEPVKEVTDRQPVGAGSESVIEQRMGSMLSVMEGVARRMDAMEEKERRLEGGAASQARPLSYSMGDGGPGTGRFLARRPTAPLTPGRPEAPTSRPEATRERADGPDETEQPLLERLTSALERLGAKGGGDGGLPAGQKALFKLDGAKGRVAQSLLDSTAESDPGSVVTCFEQQVMRYANVAPGATACDAAAHLLDVWRRVVPAKEHFLSARVGEAVVDAYRRIRVGDTEHGLARMALLLGSLEQAILDGGRWELRAESLVGLPPCQLAAYSRLGEKPKPGKLGRLALLADPVRSTTATAVFRDSAADA